MSDRSNAVETIEAGDYVAYILPDDDPFPPWDADNFGKYAHWHRREYIGNTPPTIGQGHYVDGEPHFEYPQDFVDFAKKNGWLYLPVALLDHSGWHIWVGDSSHWCDPGGWDSGQVGFIYATPEKVREWFSVKRITKKVRERALKLLEGEVKTLDDYYRGNVYGYKIVKSDDEDEVVDSCWGYYPEHVPEFLRGNDGLNELRSEIKAILESYVKEEVSVNTK
jgi:hypothetical protein